MAKKSKKLVQIHDLFEEHGLEYIELTDLSIIKELMGAIEDIEDTRHQSYISHKLKDVVMLTLIAVLSNANEWKEIEAFGKKKEKWLKTFLDLENGTPCDDTIRTIISSIDSNYLSNIIVNFLIEKIDKITAMLDIKKEGLKTSEDKEIIAIDGKTSCGTKRKETDKKEIKALHTLNAYSTDYGMCLGQVYVDEKTNEIPAMLDLLKVLDIKNKILTWDALNTQKDTIAEVIRKKGDYIGALKGNQHNFYKDVRDYFTEECTDTLKKMIGCYKKTIDKEHSAVVTREYYISNDIKWLHNKEKWSGLKSIGMEQKTIKKKNGDIGVERRYFIVSFVDIESFSRGVRAHWGVENGLHWHLDFTFKDDKNTTLAKTGAKNLQVVKKVALTILKLVQVLYKNSLKGIRYILSLDFEKEIEFIFKMLNLGDLKQALKVA